MADNVVWIDEDVGPSSPDYWTANYMRRESITKTPYRFEALMQEIERLKSRINELERRLDDG